MEGELKGKMANAVSEHNGRGRETEKAAGFLRASGATYLRGVYHKRSGWWSADNVFLGCTDMLLSQLGHQGAACAPLQQIKKASERGASLVGQLLAFSRRQILQPKILSINEIINDTKNMLRHLIGEDIELVSALSPALTPVRADPTQIQQIVLNLAVNARDAMPGGGRLTLETCNVNLDEAYTGCHVNVQQGPSEVQHD